jgi:hypothetical protein
MRRHAVTPSPLLGGATLLLRSLGPSEQKPDRGYSVGDDAEVRRDWRLRLSLDRAARAAVPGGRAGLVQLFGERPLLDIPEARDRVLGRRFDSFVNADSRRLKPDAAGAVSTRGPRSTRVSPHRTETVVVALTGASTSPWSRTRRCSISDTQACTWGPMLCRFSGANSIDSSRQTNIRKLHGTSSVVGPNAANAYDLIEFDRWMEILPFSPRTAGC